MACRAEEERAADEPLSSPPLLAGDLCVQGVDELAVVAVERRPREDAVEDALALFGLEHDAAVGLEARHAEELVVPAEETAAGVGKGLGVAHERDPHLKIADGLIAADWRRGGFERLVALIAEVEGPLLAQIHDAAVRVEVRGSDGCGTVVPRVRRAGRFALLSPAHGFELPDRTRLLRIGIERRGSLSRNAAASATVRGIHVR
jgi:hypothetical protein